MRPAGMAVENVGLEVDTARRDELFVNGAENLLLVLGRVVVGAVVV